ncbi:CerR family C-terminal domain-containing protein [Stenotrophomonas sp. BIO128-Bstrain]|uniref:TetR/AcrR family transcriptional regulator n=1 Tax=Stenotrophomonas sp. BIO128-Bstrain TaxID=3027225 RepID=UPI0024DE3E67|nr:CerR family C-terminal domain-containing protein [Stenotrophomonas sp. BIO128-Bstrain]WIA62560.1 CerR family C-terminal domain-containing protein [Stenotrophomonas sp. BIO128-Bstrain]
MDGDATKARILEGAGDLFARQGFAETTGKAIAEQAGVDLASINYHFGSRSGLYQAVLAEAHRRVVSLADLSLLAERDLAPSDRLLALLQGIVGSVTSAEGWHVRVLARELGSPSSHLQALFTDEIAPKLSHVLDIISAITGLPKEDPAVLRCLLRVGAPCLMLLIGSNLPGPLQIIAGMPQHALIRHLHAFAMAGLLDVAKQRTLPN